MHLLNKALMMGLVLTSTLAVSQDGDPDSEEAFAAQAQAGAEQASGPQLPQLMQKQPVAPIGLDAAAAPASPAPAVPTQESKVKADATNAKQAASVARQAAKVANKVAKHSMKIVGHAKKSLTHALGALHDARVEGAGLGKAQKESLKKAEAHLREATKKADYGKLKKVKDAQDLQKEKMEVDLNNNKEKNEKEQILKEIQDLRNKLKAKNIQDKDIHQALDDLEAEVKNTNGPINDESKAELERLRQLVDSLDAVEEEKKNEAEDEKVAKKMQMKPLDAKKKEPRSDSDEAVPVQEKGFDIDTAMPYGDLEPFGREDTAQELTESSIKESDGMVDQLERAEVSEEKRAVFRALTRLRGAAITSFDGVARSQTGNIDEYNKIHKWRGSHPLHHLADEESDVTKWAFPDNAD